MRMTEATATQEVSCTVRRGGRGGGRARALVVGVPAAGAASPSSCNGMSLPSAPEDSEQAAERVYCV